MAVQVTVNLHEANSQIPHSKDITVQSGSTVANLVDEVFKDTTARGFRDNAYIWKGPSTVAYSLGNILKFGDIIPDRTGQEINILALSILLSGLPSLALGSHSSSSTAAGTPDADTELAVVEKNFKTLEPESGLPPIEHSSGLWSNVDPGQKLTWSSESEIREYVSHVLKDIAREAGISNLTFRHELSLFAAQRADIWIVCNFGIPIGVVEVKRPKRKSANSMKTMDNRMVLKQLFDYVTQLKAYGGRKHAFGILSTYNEWRIVWLPNDDTDTVALCERENLLPKFNQRDLSLNVLPTQPPNWDVSSSRFNEANHQPLQAEDILKRLHVSPIYKSDDPTLPRTLLSVLRKMMSSPVTPPSVSTLKPKQSYIYVTRDKWDWKKNSDSVELTFESKIPSHFQSAYLLADLGGGGDGRVWLATTPGGKVCVLKFSNDEEMLAKEARIWKSAWSITTIVKKLNNRFALVMPWVKPCTTNEFKDDNIKAAVKEAINQLASAGYRHDDLEERHVGLYKKDGEVKALLFDLARTTELNKDDVSSAVTEMLEALELF